MSQFRLIVICILSLAVAACSGGGGGGGGGKTITGTSSSYSSDGATKTITTSYSDGTSSQQTLTGAPSDPAYSGSQLSYKYSFSDGSKSPTQTLDISTKTSESFSSDGTTKTVTYTLGNGKQISFTLAGTLQSSSYIENGSKKTVSYLFADDTQPRSTTLTGTRTNPLSDAAVYPSNWTTTGTVTKPVTHALFYSFPDQTTYTVEDGTSAKPFSQSNLTPNGAEATGAINDPNAFVSFTADAKPVNNNTPTQMTFDLHWSTPDPAGPGYAKNYFNQTTGKYDTSYKLPNSTFIFRAWLTSSSGACALVTSADPNCGATLSPPSDDIIAAWNNGWTGKDRNILIWDSIGASSLSTHPAIVQTISYRYAPGATFYGMSWTDPIPGIPKNTVLNLDGTLTSTATPIKMDAINMSWGADLIGYLSAPPVGGWTQFQLLKARAAYYSSFSADANILTKTDYQGAFNFQSAVVVKSAGNDAIDAQYEPLNWYLAQNTDVLGRLLIVGALNQLGTTTNKATLATYSNTAGADPTIQSRFLVESGRVAYADGANAYGGNPLYGSSADGNSGSVGTSFAAPRVSAYAAIVRQKFPNLTAPNTADIMLATARYDTLSCYGSGSGPTGGCDKAIYGQGEASLSRALAPVGYLR